MEKLDLIKETFLQMEDLILTASILCNAVMGYIVWKDKKGWNSVEKQVTSDDKIKKAIYTPKSFRSK